MTKRSPSGSRSNVIRDPGSDWSGKGSSSASAWTALAGCIIYTAAVLMRAEILGILFCTPGSSDFVVWTRPLLSVAAAAAAVFLTLVSHLRVRAAIQGGGHPSLEAAAPLAFLPACVLGAFLRPLLPQAVAGNILFFVPVAIVSTVLLRLLRLYGPRIDLIRLGTRTMLVVSLAGVRASEGRVAFKEGAVPSWYESGFFPDTLQLTTPQLSELNRLFRDLSFPTIQNSDLLGTGREIFALANVPTFDPARAGKCKPSDRRNRALTDPVEPGSIFKPFVMATALAEGETTPDETIDCQGGLYVIGGRKLHDHHAMGLLTTELILIRSSNIGMAKLGQRLGNERMHHALGKFGFGQLTGIDLPGENDGIFMPLNKWDTYTTTSVPMGQELGVTPIQMVTAFSSLVNGGRLLQPRVIAGVLDRQGRVIEDRTAVKDRSRSIDRDTAMLMRSILAKVVSHKRGTGRRCELDKWQVLGKTGTAQVPRKGGGYAGYLSSFIAAAPVSDPALVVLVMVRKPTRNGYYGSQVALPAVKAILEQALSYLNVPADRFSDDGTPPRLVSKRTGAPLAQPGRR